MLLYTGAMIKNYSLIAHKWSEFFSDGRGVLHLVQNRPGLQRVLDTFIAEMLEKETATARDQEILRFLFLESFLGGLVLWALEENVPILDDSFDIGESEGLMFFQWLDRPESLSMAMKQIDPITEALLSKLSVQILNKYLFIFPDRQQLLYKKLNQIKESFYFSGIAGYSLGQQKNLH
jgi:hypothetical protein